MVAGLTLTAAPVAVSAGADSVYAQAKQTAPEKSLYERLGGVFAIAAVVDHFSDAVVENPSSARSPRTRSCGNGTPRTCDGCLGSSSCGRYGSATCREAPSRFTATKPGATVLGLEEAHRPLRISPAEFDAVAAELGRTLDFAKVPKREKAEVLAAFAAHKAEVTAGYTAASKRG